MTIARAVLRGLRIPLRAPLRTASGVIRERRGFLLELEDRDGCTGHGEALPLPHFGGESLADCEREVRALSAALVGRDIDLALVPGVVGAIRSDDEPGRRGSTSGSMNGPPVRVGTPVARNLWQSALLDLYARRSGRTFAELLCEAFDLGVPATSVEISALVDGDTPAAVARSGRAGRAAGHRCFKLKVGALALDVDAARVEALRDAIGPDAELRIDANGAWQVEQALRALERLALHDLAFVEQPVDAADLAGLVRVASEAPVPVAADESLRDLACARQLLDAGGIAVLVLKLPPLGGPSAIVEIAGAARQAGVAVVLTSFLDSSLGIAVALHVAAALRVESACGFATADRLSADLVPALEVEGGRAFLGLEPGLGPRPDPECVARLAGEVLVEAVAR